MTHPQFECDLTPPEASRERQIPFPRIRFNFDNGWSASVVFRTSPDLTKAQTACLAHCPTGRWLTGRTIIHATEASADEVAAYMSEIAARPQYDPDGD